MINADTGEEVAGGRQEDQLPARRAKKLGEKGLKFLRARPEELISQLCGPKTK
jgi:hypothetical protein